MKKDLFLMRQDFEQRIELTCANGYIVRVVIEQKGNEFEVGFTDADWGTEQYLTVTSSSDLRSKYTDPQNALNAFITLFDKMPKKKSVTQIKYERGFIDADQLSEAFKCRLGNVRDI